MQWQNHNISHWYNTIIQNIEHSQNSPIVHKFFFRVIIIFLITFIYYIKLSHTYFPSRGRRVQSSDIPGTVNVQSSFRNLCYESVFGGHHTIWRALYVTDLWAPLPDFLLLWCGVQSCLFHIFQVDVNALGLGFTLWKGWVCLLRLQCDNHYVDGGTGI